MEDKEGLRKQLIATLMLLQRPSEIIVESPLPAVLPVQIENAKAFLLSV